MNTTQTWKQPSPFGELIIAAGPQGVSFVGLRGARKHKRVRTLGRPAATPPAARRSIAAAFERYFDGDAHALDRVPVDLDGVPSEFQRTVLTTLRDLVAPGATISYAELAEMAGRPGAARAVGSTMANNPVPIIVPCHRVLASDGTLGGYGGGLEMKRRLLKLEGATLRREGRLR